MNCYTTEQQVAGILRLFLWEERVKYIISRALCVSRLNLTDVAFDILLVMIGCARVTQMGIQQTLKLHWYWMDFFHVIFNLTLHCFSLLTKMYLHNCLEKKKKNQRLSQALHTLEIGMWWLKLETQFWSSAGSQISFLCSHVSISGSKHISSHHHDIVFIFALHIKKISIRCWAKL